MPDSIYDKLGDLLNEVLESGEIPNNSDISEEKNERCEPIYQTKDNVWKESSTSFNFNNFDFTNKQKIETGKIYKVNNYNYIPEYPENIKQSLRKLEITYFTEINKSSIKKAYRKILKKNHPDLQNQINENKTREIIQAYEELMNYFK